VKLGLRAQLLLALLLVTAGAIASVGAIAIWQTRASLGVERVRGARAAAAGVAKLVAVALDEGKPLAELDAHELALASGATEVALYDRAGRPLGTGAATLPTDAAGLAAALAGAPPHAEEAGGELVAYTPVVGQGAARVRFALDASIDGTLRSTREAVIVLGALDGLALLVVAAWLLRRAVVRPVLALEQVASRVADGHLDARVTTRGPGELGLLADAFDRMTSGLRASRETLIRTEKLASVGRLAAGVAHEVGNPLAAILGYVEMMLRDEGGAGGRPNPIEPELRKDMLERVRKETERIHGIIQELLAYSRPATGELTAVDAARVIDGALSLVKAQSRSRELDAEVRVAPELPPLRATPDKLTQVLLNLIINAADATDGKGHVVVEARRYGERVVISVADDGPGVPPALRDRIFDPFFTTKEPGQGTGLGLAVSASIVEGFGGTLRLAPSPKGARFEISLPVA
jgi:signal transduction histidine kinase